MSGDKNYDGTPRPPRFGLMTIVAGKRDGNWQIEVAQMLYSELRLNYKESKL
jgi:hypothetical protein